MIIRSKTTLQDLLQVEATKPRKTDRPDALPPRSFKVADQVFQWRLREENLRDDEKHTEELTRIVREHQRPLEPILVTVIGSGFYVVDGHHRLEAYKAANWQKFIPVSYFEGDVRQAQLEAFRLNSKNRLPMTRDDKREAAWRLLKEGGRTQQAIADETTVSLRAVSTMSHILKKYGDKARELTWRRALSLRWHEEDLYAKGEDDWQERKVQKMAKQLLKNLSKDAHRYPDLLARAFQIINDDLARGLFAGLDTLYSEVELEDDPEGEALDA